jgi:hypothetical protein
MSPKASSKDMLFWGLLLIATVLVFYTPKSEKCCAAGGPMA